MKRESIVFGISGVLFGLIIGWMLGAQQSSPVQPAPITSSATPAPAAAEPPALDTRRVSNLERTAQNQPNNVSVRLELANLYFDAERFDLAIPWYEAALKLDARNVNVSTDLGVAYYYTNQTDRALGQLDRSLAIDPKHVKTLLNQGIVRAFGKQDLQGAAESWQKVLAIAPDSEEGRRAKQALDGLKTHPSVTSGGRSGGRP